MCTNGGTRMVSAGRQMQSTNIVERLAGPRGFGVCRGQDGQPTKLPDNTAGGLCTMSCQRRLLFWWFAEKASGLVQHWSWPPGLGCHTYFCLRREKNEGRLAGCHSTWTQLSKAVLVEYPPT